LKKDETNDFEERIRDLRERIERLRRDIYTPQPKPIKRHEEVVETPRNVEAPREISEREKRDAELNDIKAKLLGRKK
jgi:hypothetical protein